MDAPKLGKLIGPEARKDAIHIAIVPAIATEILRPGQAVGIVGFDTETKTYKVDNSSDTPKIGIIDPFLTRPATADSRCYVLLYQDTVTSLRHEWTHPAFNLDGETQ